MNNLTFKNDSITHLDSSFKIIENGVQTTHIINAIQYAEDVPNDTVHLRINNKIITFSYDEANEFSVGHMMAYGNEPEWVELEPGFLVDQAAVSEFSVMLATAVVRNFPSTEQKTLLSLVN